MASLLVFYHSRHNRNSELIVSGVDLEEAKKFCRSPKTVSQSEGWFVGWTNYDCPDFPKSEAEDTLTVDYLRRLWASEEW